MNELRFLHTEGTLNRVKLELFRRLPNEELKRSLLPAEKVPSKLGRTGHSSTVIIASGF